MSNHFSAVQGYSDDALNGAIHSLSRNQRASWAGTWEADRLAALKAEMKRRNQKRRGKAA